MNKYKVEIKECIIYTVDVLAKNEVQAKSKATKKWKELCDGGTYHYNETDSTSEFGTIYNVTNTDDLFNP